MTARFKSLEHPLALGALALLVFNDHWLKQHHPGWLSGKLSDVAGLVLLPLWVEIVLFSARRRTGKTANVSPRGLRIVALWVTVVFFCAIQLSQTAKNLVSAGLGVAQWPFWALSALFTGHGSPPLRPTIGVADVGDLLALPALWLTRFVPLLELERPASSALRRSHQGSLAARHLASLALFATLSALSPALSAKPSASEGVAPAPPNLQGCPVGKERDKATRYCHDGFHLEFEMGGGFTWVRSAQSISNGFIQDIPSRASGFSRPDFALHVGGTLAPGWVLGGRAGATYVKGVYLDTLGESVFIRDLQLTFVEFSPFITYYPDPGGGRFFRASLGLGSVQTARAAGEAFDKGAMFGKDASGLTFTIGAGQELWFAGQWALGLSASFRFFQTLERTQTMAFGPSLAFGVTFQ